MKILVVGNASSIKGYNPKDYDMVVRLNYGIKEGDCDRWYDGTVHRKSQAKYSEGKKYKYYRTYTDEKFRRQHIAVPTTYVDATEGSVYRLGLEGSKPSTGYIAVRNVLENFTEAMVYLVGYDWYNTNNRQTSMTGDNPYHNWKMEKRILSQLDRVIVI